MAFALKKEDTTKKTGKRSPLAGWLGRRIPVDHDDQPPELDIVGGVNRALRGSRNNDEKSIQKEQQSPVRDALGAIEAALYAIDKIRDTIEQACEIALSVKDVEDIGGRALLAERYDELRLSIDGVIQQSDPRAAVLIGGSRRHLDVLLGGKTRYSVSPACLDISEAGLNLSPPRDAFSTDEEITASLEELDRALAIADRAAASYCRDAQYLIARMNGAFE